MKKLRIIAFTLLIASAVSGWAVDGLVKELPDPDTGIAGGISSCTTANGCLSCGNNVETGAKVCVKIYQNASCSCTVGTADGRPTCTTKGICTYRP